MFDSSGHPFILLGKHGSGYHVKFIFSHHYVVCFFFVGSILWHASVTLLLWGNRICLFLNTLLKWLMTLPLYRVALETTAWLGCHLFTVSGSSPRCCKMLFSLLVEMAPFMLLSSSSCDDCFSLSSLPVSTPEVLHCLVQPSAPPVTPQCRLHQPPNARTFSGSTGLREKS